MARRLRRLLWRYAGGTAYDIGFVCAWPLRFQDGVEAQLDELYDRAVFLARYVRQDITWAWSLDEEEARRYNRSVSRWVKKENGVEETAAQPFPSPFGFSDYEGGG